MIHTMKLEQLVFDVFLLELLFTGINAQLDVCGKAPLNTRIVGGQNASRGDWPWQAIVRPGSSLCGGSLISNQWVLTAAHCFQSTSAASISVSFGRLTIFGSDPNAVSRGVSQLIIHPDYSPRTNNNDVALLKLSSPIEFNDFIRPVCLAANGSVISNGTLNWVTGYGTTSSGGSIAESLQEVNVPIVSNSQCNQAYRGRITENMICAGKEGRDSCQGDSGGPMVFKKDSQWTQTGVVSFGIGCGDERFPGVYARVSQFEDWINQQIPTGEQPGFIAFSTATDINTTTTTTTATTTTTTTTTTSTTTTTTTANTTTTTTATTTTTTTSIIISGGLTAVMPHFLSLSVPLLMSIFPIVFSVFCPS